MALMCFCSLSMVVFLFPFPIVGGDEVVGLGLWFWWVVFLFLFPIVDGDEIMGLWFGCDFGGLFFFFFIWLLVVNGDEVVGWGLGLWFGYDFGGWWSWLWLVVRVAVVLFMVTSAGGFIFSCFRWWWPVAASHGCGFAKKVVGFQRKGETQIRRERKKQT